MRYSTTTERASKERRRRAELELYTPLRSEHIFEEMRRNLVERQITDEQAARILSAMRGALERASLQLPLKLDFACVEVGRCRAVLVDDLP